MKDKHTLIVNLNYFYGSTSMLKIKGIDHLVLRTNQLDNMLTFYCQVLGCKIERQLTELGLTQLRAGDSLIDLITVDGELGKKGGGAPSKLHNNLDHFCLQITDITPEILTVHLTQHGFKHLNFTTRYGASGFGLSVYIQDPDGNTVELKL